MPFRMTINNPSGEAIKMWTSPLPTTEEEALRNYPPGHTLEVQEVTLEEMLEHARTAWDQMSDEEKRHMQQEQRKSFVRAEAGFGSDADEAAYREAYEAGDMDAIKRLEEESQARIAEAEKYLK